MVEFTITLTGITQSLESQLNSERTMLCTYNVLLSLVTSRFEKRKYTAKRDQVLTNIRDLEIQIQEAKSPSQLSLL